MGASRRSAWRSRRASWDYCRPLVGFVHRAEARHLRPPACVTVALGADQGSHVELGADAATPAPDDAVAPHRATVAVDGRHTDQGLLNLGVSATSVLLTTGPMPGTVRSRSALARHAGLAAMSDSSRALIASICRASKRSTARADSAAGRPRTESRGRDVMTGRRVRGTDLCSSDWGIARMETHRIPAIISSVEGGSE